MKILQISDKKERKRSKSEEERLLKCFKKLNYVRTRLCIHNILTIKGRHRQIDLCRSHPYPHLPMMLADV